MSMMIPLLLEQQEPPIGKIKLVVFFFLLELHTLLDLEKLHAFIQTKHEEKIALSRIGFLFNHFLTPKHAVKVE